jgi:hypothetical protein
VRTPNPAFTRLPVPLTAHRLPLTAHPLPLTAQMIRQSVQIPIEHSLM